MPLLARWHVRLAFVWLLAGLVLWTALAWTPSPGASLALARPAALHCITVGFLTQVVFGVAGWLLPRPRAQAAAGVGPALDVVVLVALNAGLVLRVLAEPRWLFARGAAECVAAGAVLQCVAALAFVVRAWPRVRGK